MERGEVAGEGDWSVTPVDAIALSFSGITCLVLIVLVLLVIKRYRMRAEQTADNESWATPYCQYESTGAWDDIDNSLLTCSSVSTVEVAQEKP